MNKLFRIVEKRFGLIFDSHEMLTQVFEKISFRLSSCGPLQKLSCWNFLEDDRLKGCETFCGYNMLTSTQRLQGSWKAKVIDFDLAQTETAGSLSFL